MVVSVNPYKTLDIYDANTMEQYRGINFYELPPHLYVFLSSSNLVIFLYSMHAVCAIVHYCSNQLFISNHNVHCAAYFACDIVYLCCA